MKTADRRFGLADLISPVAVAAGVATGFALHAASVPRTNADWLDRDGKVATAIWSMFAFAQPALDLDVLRALGISMQ